MLLKSNGNNIENQFAKLNQSNVGDEQENEWKTEKKKKKYQQ